MSLSLVALLAMQPAAPAQQPQRVVPPPVMREFRAAWIATVANIDWPSKPGLSSQQQQKEMLAILDRCQEMGLNAIIFQIRPATDALYESKIEPWSEYLTGQQGRPPEPFYDPLKFTIDEAHKRGIEVHTWFNPYRSRHPSAKGPLADSHISKTHPNLVKTYGTHLWMDPGEPEVQQRSIDVMLDVVRRYDVDGIHFDDYFYPYKERGADGQLLDFPDEPSWQRYRSGGGTLGRDAWRRQNVDNFVERLYRDVKREKPWVKVGISPFGIYRPGFPPQVQGFDQFTELYADARKWFVEGWCDYYTPQLYWRIEQTPQSYPVLLNWWIEQNMSSRHLWPGNFTSRVRDGEQNWPAHEIEYQVKVTRGFAGATGNVHFSMRALMENRDGLADLLGKGVYAQPALVPASPWLDPVRPAAPQVQTTPGAGGMRVAWTPGQGKPAWRWVVQYRVGTAWTTQVLPRDQREVVLPAGAQVNAVAVSAVDRLGNQSEPALGRL
jgi:uncharacterized lipoprotein YddW (UPF0748 family)